MNGECEYKTLRKSNGGNEETKEVVKPARKKPVRNKTKVVSAAPDLGDMEGVDEEMR